MRRRFNQICLRLFSSEAEVYGYRKAKIFEMPDYTLEEQLNRSKNANLFRLVYAYRSYGHLAALLDPLDLEVKPPVPELEPSRYGLPDKGQSFNLSGIVHVGKKNDPSLPRDNAPIELIVKHLKNTYSGRIAYEFRHIPNISERRWFAYMVESFDKPTLTKEQKTRFFELLTKSEVFDHFMAKRFTQVKRYGLEGAESMMIVLDTLFRTSSQVGVSEAVVCMPHRGRLNLLTDLFQYDKTALFHKIKGNSEFPEDIDASGDVLSHLARSVNLSYAENNSIKVSMLHNPSHLEAVNPVAMGKARAKQKNLYDSLHDPNCSLGDKVICVQLHGDAAFTGQGVVMETLGLSNLPHFTCGGSIHVVVNNQIGYTTPSVNSRSSVYASDVGKIINCPVIHVNGDFPEDVAYAAQLALEYRHKFKKDVILDLITYRRWGHNELDEPAFTQPLMYKKIRDRPSVPKIYEKKLLNEKIFSSPSEIETFRQNYFNHLDNCLEQVKNYKPKFENLKGKWKSMIHPKDVVSRYDTGIVEDLLLLVGKKSVSVPEGFKIHARLDRFFVQPRLESLLKKADIDWATAESLAFGTLMLEGYHVRISGQDVGRGTFSQRHVMLVDQETEKIVVPLNNLQPNQPGKLEVANSSLSEFAVMGFEYGMSLESPSSLNIWEAQFGDFFNGAQVIIDAYLSSGEQKWLRQSGIVLLLPHGYDGAGPEHSSCRIERFLQMSDDQFDVKAMKSRNPNWHVVHPTTPAQYFHVLRRQMKRPFRKPLIVVGPKTLLKLSSAVSKLEEFTKGNTFEPVLMDNEISDHQNVEKVVFLSGKLYYELSKERKKRNLENKIAFIRVEELSPFPKDGISDSLAWFPNAKEYVWCQEEPQNMGAYPFMEPRLRQLIPLELKYVGRKPSAAPATGIGLIHKKEEQELMDDCLKL